MFLCTFEKFILYTPSQSPIFPQIFLNSFLPYYSWTRGSTPNPMFFICLIIPLRNSSDPPSPEQWIGS